MVSLLRENNVPGQVKYGIDQAAVYYLSQGYTQGLLYRIELSFKEPYLNGGLIVGTDMKLWYSRVLIKDSEQLFLSVF